jgi:large subunit ribosomal protein L25
MSNEFLLNAEVRTSETGRGGSRRLRHADKVPAIMYGAGHEPMMLEVTHKELARKLENDAFYSHILTLKIGGKDHKAVLRDLQRHPARNKLIHADFQSVSDTQRITMHVPLHFVGAELSPGMKTQGGVVSHLMNSVEVRCLAKDLPEFITADMSGLSLHQSVHLSDLKVPEGVQIVALIQGADHDLPVASVHAPQALVEEVATVAVAAAGATPAAGAAAGTAAAPAGDAKAKPEGKGK